MTLPSVVASSVAALPVLTCPACFPLYAGLLSAAGLPFVNYTSFLLPLTTALLVVAVLPLAWKAQRRRGYKPFVIGLIGAVLILFGKFRIESQPLYIAGITVLVAASIWNMWPVRKQCTGCNIQHAPEPK